MARARREVGLAVAGMELEFHSVRVREVLVEQAREFVTIGPEQFVWKVVEETHFPFNNLRGAFVRLEPPAESTDEEVAKVKKLCLAGGAERVQVLPRRRAAEVLPARERRPHRKAREVVLELLAESNFEDREALAAFIETVMSKRGL